jgi:hypothetical protein
MYYPSGPKEVMVNIQPDIATAGHDKAFLAAASISISHEMNPCDSEARPQDKAGPPRTVQTQRMLCLAWRETTALLVRNTDGRWVHG